MRNFTFIVCLALSALFCGKKESGGQMSVREAYIPETVAGQEVAAAFMTLANGTGQDDALVAAETDVCKAAELHNMVVDKDVMSMKRVSEVPVPASGTVELRHGGYHLMLIGLKSELKSGRKVELKLHFKSGLTLPVQIHVKSME